MIAPRTMTAIQLYLFDRGESVPVVRARRVVDKDARRRRKLAREKMAAAMRLLPLMDEFIAGGGRHVPYVVPQPITTTPPDVANLLAVPAPPLPEMTYAERLDAKQKLIGTRKDHDSRKRARRIFYQADLMVDWIGGETMAEMDAEIERAKAEIQNLWSDNERRKRLLGLNASEKDPTEHWTPPFTTVETGD